MANRIWIELDRPHGDMDIDDRIGFMKTQCELANNMLARLGGPIPYKFVVNRMEEYCWDTPDGFDVLEDNGKWFNLDYLGRAADDS